MFTIRYGGKRGKTYSLAESNDYMVVRTESREVLMEPRPFEAVPLSRDARTVLNEFDLCARFREAGVEVLRTKARRGSKAVRDTARTILKQEPAIEFAGRALMEPRSRQPVVYTENFFIKFDGDESRSACQDLLKRYGLLIKRTLPYARNAYFVQAPEGTGLAIFEIAEQLLQEESVELCHPELIREARPRAAFPQQWHLKQTTLNGQVIEAHANVEAAWRLSNGAGTIIAIIDDGVDIDHEEFRSSAKIVAPRDVTRQTDNPRPGNYNNHGTACAGVACAAGNIGASGVAPGAQLMPIRLASVLGSQAEADAFVWAAQNGADVISCSWGPADGDWTDPDDPLHNQVVPLPDSTRLAMEYAISQGRNGKGCVILFAAGNGNESVENDGYASFEKVIAVAACNDQGQKSAYSDFGEAVWCCFPSNHGLPSLTPGIWTTDRSGALGYNPGRLSQGDSAGNYTNSFGGTSSACPGAAGVAALVLSRNPNLRWDEVRDILKRATDRIDEADGSYGETGHSPFYGYGRLNAAKAVELAMPPQPEPVVIRSVVQDVPIKDLQTAQLPLAIADTNPLKSIKVTVDIEHTYIGDLIVTLIPPAGMEANAIILHNRQGASMDNLKKTYDEVNTPALTTLKGKSPAGTWTLETADKARVDVGQIRGFTLEMTLESA